MPSRISAALVFLTVATALEDSPQHRIVVAEDLTDALLGRGFEPAPARHASVTHEDALPRGRQTGEAQRHDLVRPPAGAEPESIEVPEQRPTNRGALDEVNLGRGAARNARTSSADNGRLFLRITVPRRRPVRSGGMGFTGIRRDATASVNALWRSPA